MKIKEVDAYIDKSAAFAQPVLQHIRKLVHATCTDVEEKIKWSAPHFDYMGPLCGMASFKQHCAFGFWKATLMKDPILKQTAESEVAMGHLGRIASLKDLPAKKKLQQWIREAMQLNADGIKLPPKAKETTPKTLEIPDYMLKALAKHKKAFARFEAFSFSHKKEYVEWITGAKQEATRERRLAKAIEQLADNKSLNWEYQAKKK